MVVEIEVDMSLTLLSWDDYHLRIYGTAAHVSKPRGIDYPEVYRNLDNPSHTPTGAARVPSPVPPTHTCKHRYVNS